MFNLGAKTTAVKPKKQSSDGRPSARYFIPPVDAAISGMQSFLTGVSSVKDQRCRNYIPCDLSQPASSKLTSDGGT